VLLLAFVVAALPKFPRVRASLWSLLALLSVLTVLPTGASAAARVEVRKAVIYGTARVAAPAPGSARLLLDLYRPAKRSRSGRPVVILIHGGGFRAGSRTDPGIVRVAQGLAERGIAVASIDYRLMGQEPVPSRRVARLAADMPKVPIFTAMTTAVDDTLAAVDYLRANARRLRLDMGRLGVAGSSAGAITADHVGYALDDHGVKGPKLRFVASLWGGMFAPAPAALGSVAAAQLERGEPSLFAVHGDADPTVPVTLDDQLVARARRQRVRNEYHRIAGGRHGYDGSGFFTRTVVGSETPYDRLLRFAKTALR
jgi:acetyl esterase/lipase